MGERRSMTDSYGMVVMTPAIMLMPDSGEFGRSMDTMDPSR